MTAPHFELEVETEAAQGLVRFRLRDGDGRQLAAHQARMDGESGALWEGIFDTRSHVLRYEGSTRYTDRPATAEDLLERLGVFLGDKVLGPEVTTALAKGVHQRTLLVRLPGITGQKKHQADDRLAAALARVPWEIARLAPGEKPLMERGLVVRATSADLEARGFAAPPPHPDEPLRVLLVFAEAPGSRPLAMRLERETLLDLFYDEVMPRRKVRVDVLCHGVTRERLRQQVKSAGGYHVVHWSGHGHHDLLELHGEDGEPDRLSGGQLLDLFAQAGGYLPNLVFLSACLSGTFAQARDWESLHRALTETTAGAAGTEAATREVAEADASRAAAGDPGYAGTALALLRAGVPQAIAMRYEVGDAYARDLARRFYQGLLADQAPKAPAQALALARAELLREHAPEHGAVDHATPLVFGLDLPPLAPPRGRSPYLGDRYARPRPLLPGGGTELDRPASFVGRGRPLTELRARWLDRLATGAPAVAVVQGLAGLGKTALVAEAIHLWHRGFGVYAFQSKPTPLTVDEFLRRLDERLALHSQAYRETCDADPNRRVYLPPAETLQGEARYRLLRDNLLEALRDERLLLVLDNFETQLESFAGGGGHACVDPEWDRLLAHLAKHLPNTGSRLVLTSRHRLASLAPPDRALTLFLGPLPMEEAALFLQDTPALRRLASGGKEGWSLARRLLTVSRGHPLILTRLGTLAGDPAALGQALTKLESQGYAALPDLFTARLDEEEREQERDYLEDVAIRSVDLLLERLTPDARRLLWAATRAFEPVPRDLLEGVWSAKTLAEEPLDPHTPRAPPLAPLVAELLAADLLTEEDHSLAFHELVKERATAWMASHPRERGAREETEVWRAYGKRYKAAFEALRRSGTPGSREQAAEAGRRGLTYLVRARAFGELAGFASALVTGTRDPSLLRAVIAELEAIADQVPAGRARWSLRTNLADAFRMAGRPDAALALYEQAAAEAETAEHWADVGWIRQNWANALRDVGRLDDSRRTYERSAAAERRAGSPPVSVVASELEALRIDVMQDEAGPALPEVERLLDEVRGWWRRSRGGETVPEAPDAVFLGRVLVSALDVAREANQALERWQACLDLVEEIEATQRSLGESDHELARTRFNRYGPLLRLGRLDEARPLLEGCLEVFRRVDDLTMQAMALSALAGLWDERGDHGQAAALGRQALAVRNRLPDLEGRSISHGNLSSYLDRLGESGDSARHLLAGIVYDLLVGHHEGLSIKRSNLRIRMRPATSEGGRYDLPRLSDLVARPGFEALRRALTERGADLEALQARIDALVEELRQEAETPG